MSDGSSTPEKKGKITFPQKPQRPAGPPQKFQQKQMPFQRQMRKASGRGR